MFLINRLRIYYHTSRYKAVKRLLAGAGSQLLDLGCGQPCEVMDDGSFLNFIGYGIGMDIKTCKLTRPFSRGDLEALPFKEATFEVVTALEVLEHLTRPQQALAEILRVLKPGGILIMSSPHHGRLFKTFWAGWVRTFGRMWQETHKSDWTRERWRQLFSGFPNLRLLETRTHWGFLFIAKLEKSAS